MAKRKKPTRDGKRAATPPDPRPDSDSAAEDQISYSSLSLHQLFEQQTRQMLDRTDLDEEQKQNILVAMSCPCCGAGAMSYTAKLKRWTADGRRNRSVQRSHDRPAIRGSPAKAIRSKRIVLGGDSQIARTPLWPK
jgi:hypothetical protein